jgi:hypothetical protein
VIVEPVDDDKALLGCLERSGAALERRELAELLGWNRKRVTAALLRLVQAERVVVMPGIDTTPQGGRPPALYSLPGMEPVQPGKEQGPYFRTHSIVVTPSGREARVLRMKPGGFCEIEYLVVRLGHDPHATLKATLLREYQPGRERPQPVRVEFSLVTLTDTRVPAYESRPCEAPIEAVEAKS